MEEKDIKFIARHYRKGRFSVEKGWRQLNIRPVSIWRRIRVAAAVAAVIVLSATAAVIYNHYTPQTEQSAPVEIVRVIDFENTPLPTVIAEIREVYGVEIDNIPENAAEYNLSLRYEGNAVDLVATINDILETQMTVKQ